VGWLARYGCWIILALQAMFTQELTVVLKPLPCVPPARSAPSSVHSPSSRVFYSVIQRSSIYLGPRVLDSRVKTTRHRERWKRAPERTPQGGICHVDLVRAQSLWGGSSGANADRLISPIAQTPLEILIPLHSTITNTPEYTTSRCAEGDPLANVNSMR